MCFVDGLLQAPPPITGYIIDTVILHRAAGILRKAMSGIKDSNDSYVSTSGFEIEHFRRFVPDSLYDFICWTTNDDAYDNVRSSRDTTAVSDADLRILAICHNIIAHCRNIRTTLTLGLGLQMHHDVDSKKLIDVLHHLGYTVSYDDVRRFVTSVAEDQLQQSEGVYVPRGIEPVTEDTNTFVDAAIDNFDQNEETIDGKKSTHAMAMVLYQRCAVADDKICIPRTTKKALEVTDCADETLNRYSKPHKRPEPPSISSADILIANKESDSYERKT